MKKIKKKQQQQQKRIKEKIINSIAYIRRLVKVDCMRQQISFRSQIIKRVELIKLDAILV